MRLRWSSRAIVRSRSCARRWRASAARSSVMSVRVRTRCSAAPSRTSCSRKRSARPPCSTSPASPSSRAPGSAVASAVPASAAGTRPVSPPNARLARRMESSPRRTQTASFIASNVVRHCSAATRTSCSARRARRSARTVASSTGGSTGCVRYASAPLPRPRTWNSDSRNVAESRRMGTPAVRGSALRRRQTSKPSIPGICTSRTTRSGTSSAAAASVAGPSGASRTPKPKRRSATAMT